MHEQLDDKIQILANWINESKYIVFLGGAGTSQESGIKPFRGKGSILDEKMGSNRNATTEVFR